MNMTKVSGTSNSRLPVSTESLTRSYSAPVGFSISSRNLSNLTTRVANLNRESPNRDRKPPNLKPFPIARLNSAPTRSSFLRKC